MKSRIALTRFAVFCMCGVSALGLGMAMPAAAQDAKSGVALEEIVVTAQKREENLQSVPMSITALSSKALETRGVRNLQDLQALVPSLQAGAFYGANLITLRGISTGSTSGAEDPSVAMHIDGVYQPRSRSLDVAMIDVERVEVLAGPQGTLYGRNATGGVVNYILKKPTREFEASVMGTLANYNRYGVQGVVSGPISDQVSYRLVGMWDRQEKGFVENLLPGAPQSRQVAPKIMGVRGALRFEPTDNLTFDLNAIYVDTNSEFVLASLEPARSPQRRAIYVPQTQEPNKIYSDTDIFNDNKDKQLSGTATWNLNDDVQLKSITAYQDFSYAMLADYDASGAFAYNIGQSGISHAFTQEVNLTTRSFNDKVAGIFGAFYLDETLQNDVRVTDRQNLPAVNLTNLYGRQTSKSYSFFTDQTLSVTDRLRLVAGIRYNKDQKEMTQSISTNGVFSCTLRSAKAEWSSWTPKGGAQYDLAPGSMAYVNWQKGFKAGGFASNTCLNGYEPETIKGWEGGIKSEFLNRRIRLNVAGYWYDYDNLQVQQSLGVGSFRVVNAANSRIKGVDISLAAAVTERLSLDVAVNIQSAKYVSFLNCNQLSSLVACLPTDPRPVDQRAESAAGNYLNRAPPHTFLVGLQYGFDVPGGELLVRGDSTWTGRTYYHEFNVPILSQKPYSIQNISATYSLEDRGMSVRVFVKNLGNTEYLRHSNFDSTRTMSVGQWAPPRTYGAEVRASF